MVGTRSLSPARQMIKENKDQARYDFQEARRHDRS